ncbi:MAG: [acyl-carrier-protein] S-malonyltransferase [Planctomycetes bacterium RBG_13_44_8b]|nr:MAG: [acyl-carrier-protein] S-malonyltransferase [Planctomycetes bacterium RBG_13_44_8b]
MADKTAYIFPGQGAQVVGMGRDFYDAEPPAKQIFDKANEILGYDCRKSLGLPTEASPSGLAKICFEGPGDELDSTVVSQPAIFVTSVAILEVLKTKKVIEPANVTAGLSLGEYTALYAAGCFSFEEGLKLVQKRGQAMQAAADVSKGSMVSIIGLEQQAVEKVCIEAAQGQFLRCANFNCPGQIVITGDVEACKRALILAEKYGAIKAVELKVAGAFHSEMMAPAAEELKKALEQCNINKPSDIAVVANVDAEYYKTKEQILQGLVRQLTGAILWQKCMERLLADGVTKFYEIGPNKVLTGLMRRIDRRTDIVNISSYDRAQAAAQG